MAITEAALKRIEEIKPDLMAQFGMRKFIRERRSEAQLLRVIPRDTHTVDDVERWLLARGVRATLELQGSTIVPLEAELVETDEQFRERVVHEFRLRFANPEPEATND